ncbi:MAG: 3-hydroxyacyl-CoA dehydrogenase NAD-binding domain-containing protein [Rhodospirillales bacterium]|nr:3-hydroxyacyl-CoA dehydrogenase NAD-binding domain-containing protein [Rhodospirillales bacterium]MCW8861668.1 3-hydroxyacyl-CoA dehydrogenase NAD-binding domain-containing protein [Rhodospirillales bacterium]MCW9040442.1 3-hydroxyacyl-CoA dehydrogenase NAD-binding domain-containing protein [Rhodospirillales bacterium]
MKRPDPASVQRIAIIGTGTVGASWAAYFLARGMAVTASDPAPDAEERLHTLIEAAWPALEQLGLSPAADKSRVRFCATPEEAVADAQFVQENAPENEDLKIGLLARIDAVAPPEVVIATSTSSLLVSRMKVRCRHPERVITAHPFNPPHIVPLVELVAGGADAEHAVDWAVGFYTRIGKKPVRLRREMKGHIANRLTAALWREAVNLVAEDVASVADIDAALTHGPGMRWAIMGPHMTYHLGGGEGGIAHYLKHLGPSQVERWKDLGTPTLDAKVCERIIEGIADEADGRSIVELGVERDEALLALLQSVRPIGKPSGD